MAVAQTCTITTEEKRQIDRDRRVFRITWEWTSATGGAVVAAGASGVGTDTYTAGGIPALDGYVASFHTKPDGDATPSSYTITLYDDDGRPIAAKSGASTSAVENHSAGLYLCQNTLSIVISGAGDAKAGSAWVDILVPG